MKTGVGKLCLALLLLSLQAACVTSDTRRPLHSGAQALESKLRDLEQRGDPAEVVAWVEKVRREVHEPSQRARFELARARALARQRQLNHADLAFLAAWKHVEPRLDPLAAEIHEGWADARLRAGSPDDAVEHYRTALRCRGLARDDERRLMASLSVAHAEAGDASSARLWEHRLGVAYRSELDSARARLELSAAVKPRPTTYTVPKSARRSPADPRAVLPELHRRSEWGARAPSSNVLPMSTVYRVTVHHSAERSPARGQAAGALRDIQNYHKDSQHWADIGYHVLIDPQGGVWEGREWGLQGAHASGANNIGNLGICLLGDFSNAGVAAAQQAALVSVLDRLRTHYGLGPDSIYTHRELKATECPGRYLQNVVTVYRARLRETLARQ
ncbi:MAG: hypothetical protein DHS20C15_01950 [Planctomycetota bacterium]|nr:MAG: hypothetical protein DHS20C15_01950 [Planctomycetota bacterium]